MTSCDTIGLVPAQDESLPSDVAELAAQFPDWRIGSVWQTAGNRPDARNLTASRDGVLLAAPNKAMLAEKIRHEGA